MDFERSAEYMSPKPVETESGYSEKESAQVIEGTQTDIKNQKKRKPLQTISRQEKIVMAYEKISLRINSLVNLVSDLPSGNQRQADLLLSEIKELRRQQDELLQMLLLEQKGELTQDIFSREAWGLIS